LFIWQYINKDVSSFSVLWVAKNKVLEAYLLVFINFTCIFPLFEFFNQHRTDMTKLFAGKTLNIRLTIFLKMVILLKFMALDLRLVILIWISTTSIIYTYNVSLMPIKSVISLTFASTILTTLIVLNLV
jgi:hypothetical protein